MDFAKLISYLFHSRTQAHVFHLQVEGEGSFAAHKALNEYYDAIVDLADGLVESYQGKYGILKGYSNFNLMEFQNCEDVIDYFKALLNTIEMGRKDLPQDSYLQNQIDEVVALVTSTIYKLTYLR
jgi:DNA-binding ferritin-like protein